MWALIGPQARVPITGNHDRRILTGVMNLRTGDYLDFAAAEFHQEHFQKILHAMRRHWRGWHIVLFLDRHTPHKAGASRQLARELNIQLRWLPKACSELNVLDHLWRHVKDLISANEPAPNVYATVERARREIRQMSPKERLRKAGVLSKDVWLADVLI